MWTKDKSNTYIGVGISASSLGSLVSILAFSLPYWIYYDENLSISDSTGSQQVQLKHYYGFWNYCNKVSSATVSSDHCGSVDTHSGAEQTTVGLLVLSIVLFLSSVVNGCLYLTLFKKEKLCLYVALVSIILAGVLALVAVIRFGTSDHSVKVTDTISLSFTISNLHASFWLTVSGCLLVVIATVFIMLAIRANRNEPKENEDKKSILSYTTANTVEKVALPDDKPPDAYPYSEPGLHEYDSSYSSSSESLDLDSCDSDDSDINSAFAKLKIKLPAKSSASGQCADNEAFHQRSKSAEPNKVPLSTRGSAKSASSFYRSRSATTLTPVELPDDKAYLATDRPSSSGSITQLLVVPSPSGMEYENNPLYLDYSEDIETGRPPVTTNLTFHLPRQAVGGSETDDLVLRRAKTEIPFTQRMKETISRQPTISHTSGKTKDTHTTGHIPFPRKPPKLKRKVKKLSEAEIRRKQDLKDAYTPAPTIQPYFPAHVKSAPWGRRHHKSLKWSLKAYGVDVPSPLRRHKRSGKDRHAGTDKDHSDADNDSSYA